jgi:membrane protease YdiL (CAAX protease family)
VKPTVGFVTLIAAFLIIARWFDVPISLATGVSVALLLAPYWAFGFGVDGWLIRKLRNRAARMFAPLTLLAAYLVFAIPAGEFRWSMFAGMSAVVLSVTLLLDQSAMPSLRSASSDPGWRDWLVLAILGISVDLHFFDQAWPVAGLSGMPKLLFVDAGLYGYLVVRPIGGIGFDFRVRLSDVLTGLREFLYFAPVAIAVGFALGFLHLHKTFSSPGAFVAGWVFTVFFVALPEELFFRGLMLNMIERRLGTKRALVITSVLFGLAHFNKRAQYFNWRYVILAAIAGLFYGRAWLAQRRLAASAITHATVDTVWSIWLR